MHDDPAHEAMKRHLGCSDEQALEWVDYIAKFTYGHPEPFFDLKRDVENLENLDRALNAVIAALDFGAMTVSARDALGFRLIWGRYAHPMSGQKLEEIGDNVRSYAETTGRKATDALQTLEDNASVIKDAVRLTKRHIESSLQSRKGTKRINLEGVQLVGSARDVWKLSTGRDAPLKALNPASSFGRFLYDLFDAFEVEGDARAAFRAWAKMQ